AGDADRGLAAHQHPDAAQRNHAQHDADRNAQRQKQQEDAERPETDLKRRHSRSCLRPRKSPTAWTSAKAAISASAATPTQRLGQVIRSNPRTGTISPKRVADLASSQAP